MRVSRRPSSGDRAARRCRRPRRVERPGDGRSGRPERARADGGPSLPERAGPTSGRPPLGHPAALPRGGRGLARGEPGRGRPGQRSGSTRGRSTTACSTRPGACSATRTTTATTGTPRRSTAVHAVIAPADLYARTGLQFLPFNTIYQLAAARGTAAFEAARTMLLIPDLLGYWLIRRPGRRSHERVDDRAPRRPPADVGRRSSMAIARIRRRTCSRRSVLRAR